MCVRIAIASEPAVFSRRYTRLDSHLEPRRSEFPEIVRKVHLCSACSYATRDAGADTGTDVLRGAIT